MNHSTAVPHRASCGGSISSAVSSAAQHLAESWPWMSPMTNIRPTLPQDERLKCDSASSSSGMARNETPSNGARRRRSSSSG